MEPFWPMFDCFGSATRAENDCPTCPHQEDCLKVEREHREEAEEAEEAEERVRKERARKKLAKDNRGRSDD